MIFKIAIFWAWNLAIGQSSRSCTYTLLLPQRVEIGIIFALRPAISKIGRFSKLPYLGMKVPEIAHILPELPPSSKFHSVWLYGWPFQDIGNFPFPIGHKIKFQSFFKNLNFEISKFL